MSNTGRKFGLATPENVRPTLTFPYLQSRASFHRAKENLHMRGSETHCAVFPALPSQTLKPPARKLYLSISGPEKLHSILMDQLKCCVWSENSPLRRRNGWPHPNVCVIIQYSVSKSCALLSGFKVVIGMVMCSVGHGARTPSQTTQVQSLAHHTVARRCL